MVCLKVNFLKSALWRIHAIKGILEVLRHFLPLNTSKSYLKCKAKVGYQLSDDSLGTFYFLWWTTSYHLSQSTLLKKSVVQKWKILTISKWLITSQKWLQQCSIRNDWRYLKFTAWHVERLDLMLFNDEPQNMCCFFSKTCRLTLLGQNIFIAMNII